MFVDTFLQFQVESVVPHISYLWDLFTTGYEFIGTFRVFFNVVLLQRKKN